MFETLTDRFNGIFNRLAGKGRLGEADVDATLREVRLALLEADVNVVVTRNLLSRIRQRAIGSEVHESLTPGQQVIKIVHEELVSTLGGAAEPLEHAGAGPQVILLVGLQGSGKTTTAAKLARYLLEQGRRPMLVAADLQRPAAIEQLQTLGTRAGVPVFAERGSKPVRVVKDALKQAAVQDVVIIDSAGRLTVDEELMAELRAVRKAAEPDEVLLVIDAMTGQVAVSVAQGFLESTELTGIVLSKLDGDSRGGAAISVREVTGRPIKFATVGEGLEDIEVFHPDRMASRILGMGDVLTLIDKAERVWDEREAESMAEKLQRQSFTLEDFLDQYQRLKRMGPLQGLVAMLPGAGAALKDADVSEKDLARVEAIIRSMTPDERQQPRILDGSRKRRVARGSGTTPQEVNKLLKQFAEMQKMMKMLADGKSIPGLPGVGVPTRKR